MAGRKSRDYTGQSFGRWTALERGIPMKPSKPGVAVPWLCQCERGHQQWVKPREFTNPEQGQAQCSACHLEDKPRIDAQLHAKREEKRIMAEAASAARQQREDDLAAVLIMRDGRWNSIRRGAAKRDIPFNITMDEATAIFRDQGGLCALTGMKITMPKSDPFSGTASLDRIRSSEGYVSGNVQWVHKKINMMKQAYGQCDFIAMCERVAAHRASGGIPTRCS